jgi:hypothetical protein
MIMETFMMPMGGKSILRSTGEISIDSVFGNIVITASAS